LEIVAVGKPLNEVIRVDVVDMSLDFYLWLEWLLSVAGVAVAGVAFICGWSGKPLNEVIRVDVVDMSFDFHMWLYYLSWGVKSCDF
jgi:hypothetical protein